MQTGPKTANEEFRDALIGFDERAATVAIKRVGFDSALVKSDYFDYIATVGYASTLKALLASPRMKMGLLFAIVAPEPAFCFLSVAARCGHWALLNTALNAIQAHTLKEQLNAAFKTAVKHSQWEVVTGLLKWQVDVNSQKRLGMQDAMLLLKPNEVQAMSAEARALIASADATLEAKEAATELLSAFKRRAAHLLEQPQEDATSLGAQPLVPQFNRIPTQQTLSLTCASGQGLTNDQTKAKPKASQNRPVP